MRKLFTDLGIDVGLAVLAVLIPVLSAESVSWPAVGLLAARTAAVAAAVSLRGWLTRRTSADRPA